ncbi:TPA: HNH endonuclease [Yersinia enterocolitica]|nr:HNH endonuclease [Yersinia enterocolitica]HDV5954471.1 HNH endonuclease [Yersinia enterocolitica]HEN3465146.1 HNH endonuclease [Yersinia enterocolitica]
MAKITKKQRAQLREMFGGKCAYCGCELPERGWHADHIEPVIRKLESVRLPPGTGFTHKLVTTGEMHRPELDSIENLYPSCAPCNIFKASMSLESFRSEISEQMGRLKGKSVNYRTAFRFGQVIETPSPVIFWFEKFNCGGEQNV